MAKKVLVLNMGMKSIRSIIFDACGNKLASAAYPLTTALNDDEVTQEPSEWWNKACHVIKETLSIVTADKIDYMTITSSAACLLAVDEKFHPLTTCIMVSDRRANSYPRNDRILKGRKQKTKTESGERR